jgi:phage FluMu protein gp41
MTTIADNKKRVTLRTAKPGDRFDVQVSGDGKIVLTPLLPVDKPNRIRLVRKHGYTVAVGEGPVTQEQVRKLLDEFP